MQSSNSSFSGAELRAGMDRNTLGCSAARASAQVPDPLHHRVAISNQRLLSLEDVGLRYKNYAADPRNKTMSLQARILGALRAASCLRAS